MGLLLDIALAHLRHRRRQSVVSMTGVAMGVGFFIAMAALLQGSQQDFVDKMIQAGAHIVMKDEFREARRQPVEIAWPDAAVSLSGRKPREELRGIRNAPLRMARIAHAYRLDLAPLLSGQAFLRYGGTDVAATILGIEPERERRVTRIAEDMLDGAVENLLTVANGIILGEGLARKLGAARGDTITAVSPTGVTLSAKVVGRFRTGVVSIDQSQAYLLLKKAQVLHNRPNVVNQIRIKLPDHRDARAVAREIEAAHGYRTESWDETNEDLLALLVVRNIILYIVTGAILVVAAFGIYNIISTVVFEKTRDIAILKSIGLTQADIRRIFLIEGLAVGGLGSLMGWAAGLGLTLALGSIRFEVQALTAMQRFTLDWSFAYYAVAGIAATAASTLAAYLPARRAAALKPVEIVRGAN
jgi:lipoprotein-releasing system permease protein